MIKQKTFYLHIQFVNAKWWKSWKHGRSNFLDLCFPTDFYGGFQQIRMGNCGNGIWCIMSSQSNQGIWKLVHVWVRKWEPRMVTHTGRHLWQVYMIDSQSCVNTFLEIHTIIWPANHSTLFCTSQSLSELKCLHKSLVHYRTSTLSAYTLSKKHYSVPKHILKIYTKIWLFL